MKFSSQSIIAILSLLVSVVVHSAPLSEKHNKNEIMQTDFITSESSLNKRIVHARKAESASNLLNIELQKARLYMLYQRPDLLAPFLNELQSSVKSIGSASQKAYWYTALGYVDYVSGSHIDAEVQYDHAVIELRDTNADYQKAELALYRGMNLVFLRQYDDAMETLIAVNELAQGSSWQTLEARTLFYIGDMRYELKDYAGALEYYESSYSVYPEIDSQYRAEAQMAIAQMVNLVRTPKEALQLLDLAITAFDNGNNKTGLGDAYLLKSYFLSKLNDKVSALDWIMRSVELRESLENKTDITNAYVHYSAILSDNELPELAIEYGLKAVYMAEQLEDLVGRWDAYGVLAELLYNTGKYQQAYEYMHKAERTLLQKGRFDITLETSRLNAEFNVQRQELENKYLDQQKILLQERNSLLQKQIGVNEIEDRRQIWAMIILSVVLLFFLIASGVIYRLYAKTKELASIDVLTGLHNRRSILELGEHEFTTSKRYGHQLSVLMLDVDNFKLVNDRYGHEVGDQVLKRVAKLCMDTVRDADFVGRIGGEEFLLILPHTSLDDAVQLADRLRSKMMTGYEQKVLEGQSVTVSIGVSTRGEACQNLTRIVREADTALYEAKNGGRNQVKVFHKDMKFDNKVLQFPQ